MAIQSITYEDSFRLRFRWPANVKGTIIYAVPKGEPLHDTGALLRAAVREELKQFNAIRYDNGIMAVSFAPPQEGLKARWIDICCCDFDADFQPLFHDRIETCFNGACRVQYDIQYIPLSPRRQAVEITLHNRSDFPIEPNGIGYSVNGRVRGIPLGLGQSELKVLPQFDVGVDDVVRLCRMENSYPVTFKPMER